MRKDYCRIAKRFRAPGTSLAELAAQIAIDEETLDARREFIRAAGWNEHTASLVHDLGWSAHRKGDYRQRLRERFHENQSEGFGGSIRLAENIGGSHQLRYICTLADEAHAVSYAKAGCPGFEGPKIGLFVASLGAANKPDHPRQLTTHLGGSFQQLIVPFPRLHAADLNDYYCVVGRIEFGA